jgi:hypothetical protein
MRGAIGRSSYRNARSRRSCRKSDRLVNFECKFTSSSTRCLSECKVCRVLIPSCAGSLLFVLRGGYAQSAVSGCPNHSGCSLHVASSSEITKSITGAPLRVNSVQALQCKSPNGMPAVRRAISAHGLGPSLTDDGCPHEKALKRSFPR